jgi:S1-C subfamily serine protease
MAARDMFGVRASMRRESDIYGSLPLMYRLPATQTKVATSSGLQENNAAPSKEPEQEQASPEQEESASSGSGFAVSNDGLILTNRHVVENCKGISVADFRSAIIKAVDEQNDLALLKIQGTTSAAKFCPSAVGFQAPSSLPEMDRVTLHKIDYRFPKECNRNEFGQ